MPAPDLFRNLQDWSLIGPSGPSNLDMDWPWSPLRISGGLQETLEPAMKQGSLYLYLPFRSNLIVPCGRSFATATLRLPPCGIYERTDAFDKAERKTRTVTPG